VGGVGLGARRRSPRGPDEIRTGLPQVATMMHALRQIKLWKLVLVTRRTEYEYLASAVILWVAIWISTASVLDASAFDDMVPILGGGTVISVVILPAGLFHRSRQ
jgi:hypothetical protein